MKLQLLAVIVTFASCLEWFEEGNPVFLTDENFTAVTSKPRSYKFIKLFTPWCRYCRVLKEVVKELHQQLEHRKDIIFYEVNCHEQQNTCFQLQAFSFPMTVIYGPDGQLKDRIVGALPLQVMREFVDRNTQEEFKEGESQHKEPEAKIEESHSEDSPKQEKPQTQETKVVPQAHQEPPAPHSAQEKPPAQTITQPPPAQYTGDHIVPNIGGADAVVQEPKHNSNNPQHSQSVAHPPKEPAVTPPEPEIKHASSHDTVVEQSKPAEVQRRQPEKHEQHPSAPLKTDQHKDTPVSDEIAQKEHVLDKQMRSLQNHPREVTQHNPPHEASKLYVLAFIGIGVVMGYFLHDVINRDHTRAEQQPI